ncbi:MAG: hypothetical protein JSR66_31830 [Proteobacteria bacterium]|nr:hypothetical protein [Pseudomonadota bacterium]
MDRPRERNPRATQPLNPPPTLSRRAVVAGTVATTAVAAVLPLSNSAQAQAPDPQSSQDMMAFLLLSEALTGVDKQILAPEFSKGTGDILDADPGIDPINVKSTYFKWLAAHAAPASFAKVLQIAKDNRTAPDKIIAAVTAGDDDTKFLGRSIVLLWYLGSWYDPADLKRFATAPAPVPGPIPSQVVSAKAYTQGLAWQVVGAHPMGYSNLQFGYWSREPSDPNDPNDPFRPKQS